MKTLKTLTYVSGNYSVELEVSNYGEIYKDQKLLKQFQIGKNPYMYTSVYVGKGKSVLINVARAILMAFKPKENQNELQADHIDSNPTHNVVSNLRWVTRKQNNNRLHSRKLKSANAKATSHPNQIIKAVKGDEVLTAPNVKQMARLLGCSHVILYRILNPDDYAKSVFGYKITREYQNPDANITINH